MRFVLRRQMKSRFLFGFPLAIGILVAGLPTTAIAQYYYPPGDPCAGLTGQGTMNGYIYQLSAAQQAQACQQARAAALQRQQTEYAAAQARAAEEKRASDRARAVLAYKLAAENSPDNICREASTAGVLIKSYNGLDWEGWSKRQVIDIEHLVTLRNESQKQFLVCHGTWVHTNGARLEGTMTMRLNVAGDTIVSWKPEDWAPSIPDPPLATEHAPAPAPTNTVSTKTAFEQGVVDRQGWEDWFAATTGDYRTGAVYWAAQRSLPHPGSCATLGGDATSGCTAAQARLSPTDARRKTEPDYRAGWNSL
jgi:hypothetical protein